MGPAIEKFLGYLRSVRNASPNTLRGYRADLEQFLAYLSPPVRLRRVRLPPMGLSPKALLPQLPLVPRRFLWRA